MISGNRSIYLGCATDRKFVGPTAAMLSSVEDNGGVAECVVIVADFGLTEEDRAVLRDSAGRLGAAMRFIELSRSTPKIAAMPEFAFPLPLLGRLILPGEINDLGARLLLIDSDIVVNGSLRPLFEMDMCGKPLAAVQDPLMEIEFHHHRKSGPVYFNAGLMLLDLDRFNGRGVGDASLKQLASYEQLPIYIDQCAMNDVLQDDWLEIDRKWNFFQTGYDRHFERHDYEAAQIIHFAGYKPWDVNWHPAGPIWNHHATRAQQRSSAWRARINVQPVDRSFVAMQYQVLLGRELEQEGIAIGRQVLTRTAATAIIVNSSEFRERVLDQLREGRPLRRSIRRGPPLLADRYWAADCLPVLPITVGKLMQAKTWRALLGALAEDARFMGAAEMEPVLVRPLQEASEPSNAVEASTAAMPHSLLGKLGIGRTTGDRA